jgi:HEAT repeat protein
MHDCDPQVRVDACSILLQTTPDHPADALGALLDAARDSDPGVRAAAVAQLETFLSRYGALVSPGVCDRALQGLCDSLDDESPEVRRRVLTSFFMVGSRAKKVVGKLDRSLEDADRALRVAAAVAMLRIDPEGTRARVSTAMSTLLTDPSLRIEHWRLVAALVRAQGQDATAEMLIKHLKHPDRQTRSQVLHDLITHCSSGKGTRAAMLETLNGADAGMSEEAAFYFLKTEPAMVGKAVEMLAKQIAHPDEGSYLARNLVKRAREASPVSMEPLASKLLDLLARAPTHEGRVFVITALGEIGPKAALAVPAMIELSSDKNLDDATRAVASLVKIDSRSAAAKLPSLIEWIRPRHEAQIRLRAMNALRDMGPAASSAIPVLLEIADEDELAISTGAIEAICRIDPVTGTTLKQSIERGEIGSDDRAASAVSSVPQQ